MTKELQKSLEAHAEETAEGIREYAVGMMEATQKLKLWLCYRYVDSPLYIPDSRESSKNLQEYLNLAPIKEMMSKMNWHPAEKTVRNYLSSYHKRFAPFLEKTDFEGAFQKAAIEYGLKILDAPRKQSKKELCSGVCTECRKKCGKPRAELN